MTYKMDPKPVPSWLLDKFLKECSATPWPAWTKIYLWIFCALVAGLILYLEMG